MFGIMHIMVKRLSDIFIKSSGVILAITAGAKLISAVGSARVLSNSDTVFLLPFRYLFIIAACIELFVSAVCFWGKWDLVKLSLVAWLSTIFLGYRAGLIWTGYRRPCPCLGNLTETLHLDPHFADTMSKILLVYLLIGSYSILFYISLKHVRSFLFKNHINTALLSAVFAAYFAVCNSGFADDTPAEAFKSLLSNPRSIREIDWIESVCDGSRAPYHYSGAIDGTNFFIRMCLPGEDVRILLSPTNKLGMPFFVGRVHNMSWEIPGTLMINESYKTNIPLSTLVDNGRIMLSEVLAFGLCDVKDGAFIWDGDKFNVPRAGIIPTKIMETIGGVTRSLPITNVDGSIFVTNGFVDKIICNYTPIYYSYDDKSLPLGVPSKIVIGKGGDPNTTNCFEQIQIVRLSLATNIDEAMFEPTNYILPGHFGIVLVSSNSSQVEIDNTYVNSRMKTENLSKSKRHVIYWLFLISTVPIFLLLKNCFKGKSSS